MVDCAEPVDPKLAELNGQIERLKKSIRNTEDKLQATDTSQKGKLQQLTRRLINQKQEMHSLQRQHAKRVARLRGIMV